LWLKLFRQTLQDGPFLDYCQQDLPIVSEWSCEMKIVLCFLLLAILFHPGQSIDRSGQSFRIIPIPTREHGYGNFPSIVLRSQQDLDSFLTTTSAQIGWNSRQAFEDALRNAEVDFSKEALVLLRHTEGSGAVQVTFETPVLQGRDLVCEIRGKPFPAGYGGTTDMAYYCFAVAVSKAEVSHVKLQASEGGLSARPLAPIVLAINDKETANTIQDCPVISVTCPELGATGNTRVKFIANVSGGKPKTEISYKWSVSKGTIKQGQGTAVVEIDFAGVGVEGLTASVEVKGFEPNCQRLASCATAIY
jgi:hypothetical protein